jgi:hypothetical protein
MEYRPGAEEGEVVKDHRRGEGVRAAGQSCMPVLSAEVMSSHPSWLRSKF